MLSELDGFLSGTKSLKTIWNLLNLWQTTSDILPTLSAPGTCARDRWYSSAFPVPVHYDTLFQSWLDEVWNNASDSPVLKERGPQLARMLSSALLQQPNLSKCQPVDCFSSWTWSTTHTHSFSYAQHTLCFRGIFLGLLKIHYFVASFHYC